MLLLRRSPSSRHALRRAAAVSLSTASRQRATPRAARASPASGSEPQPGASTSTTMELTFFGTSSGSPSATRNQQSLALRLEDETWLFDCGEATQYRMEHSSVSAADISRIFVSHLHGDHCFGLPGLLARMATDAGRTDGAGAGARPPVQIVGPVGLRAWLRSSLCHSEALDGGSLQLQIHEIGGMRKCKEPRMRPRYQLDTPLRSEVESWTLMPDEDGSWEVPPPLASAATAGGGRVPVASVRAVELDHTIPTVGWVVQEARQPGSGGSGSRSGRATPRKLAILSDCRDPSGAAHHAAGAHLLVHEATNACTSVDLKAGETFREVQRSAWRHGHSTPQMAGAFAEGIGAKHLVLTHFSVRYAGDATRGSRAVMREIQQLARSRFAGPVETALDLMTLRVGVDGAVTAHPPPALVLNGWETPPATPSSAEQLEAERRERERRRAQSRRNLAEHRELQRQQAAEAAAEEDEEVVVVVEAPQRPSKPAAQMKVGELRAALKERGLPTDGLKAVLVARLQEHLT